MGYLLVPSNEEVWNVQEKVENIKQASLPVPWNTEEYVANEHEANGATTL
jgi:hypothetical protein